MRELADLAADVLDGVSVNWQDAETHEDDRQAVCRLRVIAEIAQAFRDDAPRTWGPLRVLERIGRGSYGEVFRARDPRLDRELALKLLPADGASHRGDAPSIIEEGRLLARVRHPNVVTIHGAEQIGDRIGLWMEFVDGRTLHDLVLTDRRTFAAAELAAIGRALCGAVAAVHEAGLLHRDITARNVMLARDGRVVLMDFGASRDRRAPGDVLAGTPLYLAPEVLAGARPSVASDVYSIGVLLYFLVTAAYPVTGTSVDELRHRHARGDRLPWPRTATRVPAALRRAIEGALETVPGNRPATAQALANTLAHVSSWRRTSSARVAAGVGLALVVASAVWLGFDRPAPAAVSLPGATASPGSAGDGVGDAESRAREFGRAWAMTEAEGVIGPGRAAEIFRAMIAADPDYAPAHAGLAVADAYLSMSPYQGRSAADVESEMRTASTAALRLDPGLAEAHVARGWVLARERDWAQAEQSFQEAIRLDPMLIGAYTGLTHCVLIPFGRNDEAEALLRKTLAREPRAPHVRLTLGRVLLQANRPADAIAVLEPARPSDSDLLVVDLYLGRSLALLERLDEALPLLERRRQRLVDPAAAPEPWVAWVYVALGRRADAESLAEKYDHLPFRRAIINGALGRVDRMFHGMEEMAEREPQRLPHLMRAPELAAYRKDARFLQLVKRLRLTDAAW